MILLVDDDHRLRELTARVKAIQTALERRVDAEIFGVKKQQISLRVYATDASGKVLYDSAGFGLGKDYSKWNDVFLTLKGRYGARSSRDDERYPNVSIKYIAAPIRSQGRVVGVLTQLPAACDSRNPAACGLGAATRYRFRSSWEQGAPEMSVVVSNLEAPLEVGQTYVLYGTVNVAPEVPERWELRAVVLARVR